MGNSITRRTFLAAIAVLCGTAVRPAVAQTFPSFSSVQVDVSVLRARGHGPMAELVGTAMADELRQVFADRLTGRGPRLVVRVTGLHITGFLRSGSWKSVSSDSLDGEALIVSPRGEILARYPQFAPRDVFARATEPNELGRAEAVARHYARWLRRTIG